MKTKLSKLMNAIATKLKFKNKYTIVCRDKDGNVKWEDVVWNAVCDLGILDVFDKYFRGSSYSAAHYLILLSATPVVAEEDTMLSHAGWTEVTGYASATRPQITWDAPANNSIDNSTTPVRFTINANGVEMGGIAITTNSTKGGSTGILYGGGEFVNGDKKLSTGDTLDVTVIAAGASA